LPKKEVVKDENGFKVVQKKFLAKPPTDKGGYRKDQKVTFSKKLPTALKLEVMEFLDHEEVFKLVMCNKDTYNDIWKIKVFRFQIMLC
jgi:hypothetical protein